SAQAQSARSYVPPITHVDCSATLQTVDPLPNGRYHRLIARFCDKTGCPLLINTSLNIRGEPIAASPSDAYRCFMTTNMDALVIENFVLQKERQAPLPATVIVDRRSHFAVA